MENARLLKVQKVCRFLKIGLLLYLGGHWLFVAYLKYATRIHPENESFTFFNRSYATIIGVPAFTWVMVIIANLTFAGGVIAFYRLLRLYERGMFFTAKNVLLLKAISLLIIAYSLCGLLSGLVEGGISMLNLIVAITSPWVVVGGAVYVVAWAMEEGRKMHEEQALTV